MSVGRWKALDQMSSINTIFLISFIYRTAPALDFIAEKSLLQQLLENLVTRLQRTLVLFPLMPTLS